MAYAAVISLKQTINGLLSSSRISLVSYTREIFEFAYNETTSLQNVLERFNDDSNRDSSERLDDLEGQIRDCAHQLEDVVEFYELYSQQENYDDEEVRQQITSFAETVKKMEVEYILELSNPVPQDDDDATVSSNIDFGAEMMVGHSSEFIIIRDDHLLQRMRPDDLCFFSVHGEVGSGRLFVVKTLFEELCKGKQQIFNCCAWVTIGTKYGLKEVLIRILAQVDNLAGDYEMLISIEDEKLWNYLCKALEHRSYMIVLEDVHDVKLLDYLRKSLPDRSNGSVVLFTTSSEEVSQLADSENSFETPRDHREESIWFCLRLLIFGTESISPELEEAGKKIVGNCQGFLISVAKTFLFLYKTENSVEQWRKIAADKENPIFMVGDEILELCKIKTEMQSYNWDMDDERDKALVGFISTWVDFYCYVEDIKMKMHPERFFYKMQIISLLGMAGIGKSTFARKIFKDRSIMCHFDHHVWVTLGPKYQAEEILIDILAKIYPSIDKKQMKEDEKLARNLCIPLSSKRCLIVMDDLCSKEPLHYLKILFPDIKGKVLVTTRLAKLAEFGGDDINYKMRFLNKEESWCLLRQKVFAEGLCPPELKKVGRKIAENCEGLPLLILKVADQLLKVEMSQEYWNNVASGKQKSIFMNAHHEISKALLPSYESLPQHLKACFLYVGLFRNNYEIPTYKLTNLWTVEGFLEPNSPQIIEDFITECLTDLVDRSLVMVQRKVSDLQIKTCRLHSVFWHLSNSVAVKNKFSHVMNSYDDCSIESMKSQRRLCIRNSILLGIKDVYNAMQSSSKSRALLCTGPSHQYPVPLYFGSRLLRVLDALAIHLYEFPVEVVELIHLRYLGLTCNGKLPTSISKLCKLQHLIVSRYVNTRSSENSSILPVEIWDMKELKHLQFMGGCLPNPKCGAGLRKLSTLLDVSAQSCTKKVLKRIPNLKRLGIRIELAPDDKGNPFRCLNRISRLRRLESLKCVVVNPNIGSDEVLAPPDPVSMFPSSLTKLSLSGFGYPWEYMSTISKLKNLEVLKLKLYAFRGPKWEHMDYTTTFSKLKFLLVEDTDLVHWNVKSCISMQLERLSIKHCYELQELPTYLPSRLQKIEIVDCNPFTVTWAEQMKETVTACKVVVHLSWIDSQLDP